MFRRSRFLGPFLALVFVLAVGATATASALIGARAPETARGPAIVPPSLVPPGQGGYVAQGASSVLSAPDGRPIARLETLPAGLPNVGLNLPNAAEPGADQIAYVVLTSVRYTGPSGGRVVVTTAKPSAAASSLSAVFGDKTVTLADGTTAYVKVGLPGENPNRVVQVRDGLIITVAGTLPADRLQELMTQVIVG